MTIVIAGSRGISDGKIFNSYGQYVRFDPEVERHNLNLLDEVIRKSGFHTHAVNMKVYTGPGYRIDRQTPLGNPFTHLPGNTLAKFKVGTRAEAIEKYKEWFPDQTHLHPLLVEMKGKALLCHCKPADCHGDYLADLAGRVTGVVHGTARGSDTLGKKWAAAGGVREYPMPADWDKWGKAAGHRRNKEMAERPDVEGGIVLLAQPPTPGSLNMIEELEWMDKPCYVQKVRVENHLAYLVD